MDANAGNSLTTAGPLDPEELEASAAPEPSEISPWTTLGPVQLTVADLARSRTYYEDSIGLETIASDGDTAALGAGGRPLLELVEAPGARPVRRSTGLYHFALLLPERADLARWLAHAIRDRVPLTGLSDHFVSEAIYMDDPDGHGIEIYWDRPRSLWEGQVASRLTTLPLDVQSLLGELADPADEPFDRLPDGSIMGHIHLKVADIAEAVAFYRDGLGFGLKAQLGSHAAFLSAGGYHHHVGANTWESAGTTPAPTGAAALRHATIVLPGKAEVDLVVARLERHGYPVGGAGDQRTVHDPSGNELRLESASA